MATLRAALRNAGAVADSDIDVPGLVTPLVAQDAAPQCTIEQIDYDRTGGRFTATLAIAVESEPIQRMRLSGNVREMADTVVTTHRLMAGSVIGPGDLTLHRQRAEPTREAIVRDPLEAIGLAVRHMAAAGQTLSLADLAVPFTIQKGARVTMELSAPGLSLTGVGQAQESGVLGATISVLNPLSRAVVEAEILGPDRVRVTPGTAPRAAARPQAKQVSQR
jgi:flagella basal body P-ring formation protein FlgA